jgi:hypothetical protein
VVSSGKIEGQSSLLVLGKGKDCEGYLRQAHLLALVATLPLLNQSPWPPFTRELLPLEPLTLGNHKLLFVSGLLLGVVERTIPRYRRPKWLSPLESLGLSDAVESLRQDEW